MFAERSRHIIHLAAAVCLAVSTLPVPPVLADYVGLYGSMLCRQWSYNCVIPGRRVVEKTVGERVARRFDDPTWESAWPDRREREIVMKVNRINVPLEAGMKVAVPVDIAKKELIDYSPFPETIAPPGERLIVFDPLVLAFAAYYPDGRLARWGPAVGGRGGYRTPAGDYEITSKGDASCRSRKYPKGCRGSSCAPMPYCMVFLEGYAMHGGDLTGRHESHGCIRLFADDAKWLNLEFAPEGTRLRVNPYYRERSSGGGKR